MFLTDLYSPAMVLTTIHGRLYEQEWLSASSSDAPSPIQRRPTGSLTRADEYIDTHSRVAVLGSAGSGKTTLLRHLALAMCDKKIFGIRLAGDSSTNTGRNSRNGLGTLEVPNGNGAVNGIGSIGASPLRVTIPAWVGRS